MAYLGEQEGDGGEGEGPAVLVVEEGLATAGPAEHLVVYSGDVQNKTHNKSKAWWKEHRGE